MPGIDPELEFVPINIAILTISDTRTLADDTSGDLLTKLVREAGHAVTERDVVRDDTGSIAAAVVKWISDPSIHCILTTGGTGFTGRDVTPEAVKPLFDKEIEGFAILFHRLSYEKVGTSTIQSRACGGVSRGTYIFCLPGSTGACRDAWDGILKMQLDARHRPCNFIEIMPRLEEHRKTASKS